MIGSTKLISWCVSMGSGDDQAPKITGLYQIPWRAILWRFYEFVIRNIYILSRLFSMRDLEHEQAPAVFVSSWITNNSPIIMYDLMQEFPK